MQNILTAQGFVLDMDGTFFLGDSLLPGALELLALLNERGLPFSFLTNNTSKGKQDYVKKLTRLGVCEEDARIFTAGDATIGYLKENFPGRRVFLMGTQSLAYNFADAGINLVEQDPEVLVLGYDTELTYPRLTQFCQFVSNGLPYIATHPDINCPIPEGFAPDIGAMMALIETSTGRRADTIIGKPNPGIIQQLANRWQLEPGQLVMVGDRLYTDIALGKTAGVMTVLVLSGETKPEDLQCSEYKPDLIVQDLSGLVDLLSQNQTTL